MPPKSSSPRAVLVKAVPIELTPFLKVAGLGGTGGELKVAIQGGQVRLNGVVETRRAKKLSEGDQVTFGGETVVVRLSR